MHDLDIVAVADHAVYAVGTAQFVEGAARRSFPVYAACSPSLILRFPNYYGGPTQWGRTNFPCSEYLVEHMISLPIYPELTDQQVSCLIMGINEFYG
jgi:dTDP-4-amino-4,6-dideoxygalactose transaminase